MPPMPHTPNSPQPVTGDTNPEFEDEMRESFRDPPLPAPAPEPAGLLGKLPVMPWGKQATVKLPEHSIEFVKTCMELSDTCDEYITLSKKPAMTAH
jgi:hypothetical protein